jgi:2-oxo-3-hexenedioate decarboxylase
METLLNLDTQQELAIRLTHARLEAKGIPQLSGAHKFTRLDAYRIQDMGMEYRFKAGEGLVGYKMGLTSKAKREQMNLDSPLYGCLTNTMQVPHEGTFSLKGSIHPKIEPEVAFLMKNDIHGIVSRDELLQNIEAVCACLEILDSRYEQFKYFSMEDVISDNSSSSHFITGPWTRDFHSLALDNLEMKMKVDDEVVEHGSSSAISGDPLISVLQLLELFALTGHQLKAGQIVLAGAATTAVNLQAGMKVSLEVQDLPAVWLNITA